MDRATTYMAAALISITLLLMTAQATPLTAGTAIGIVCHDRNANGVYDPGEPGIAGRRITARNQATGRSPVHATVAAEVITGHDGMFLFTDLPDGHYWVLPDIPTGWTQTAPFTVFQVITVQNGSPVEFSEPFLLTEDEPEWRFIPREVHLKIGVADDGAQQGDEPTMPRDELKRFITDTLNRPVHPGCDSKSINSYFAHSFSLPPQQPGSIGRVIKRATLTVRVHANATISGNDGIVIYQPDRTGRHLPVCEADISNFNNGRWGKGNMVTIVIDLATFPGFPGTINVLPTLADDTLDFCVQDDSGVDFAILDVEYYDLISEASLGVEKPIREGASPIVRPNPARENATVMLPPNVRTGSLLLLYDLQGRMVRSLDPGVHSGNSHAVTITTHDIPAGMYVLRVQGTDMALPLHIVH